jgi:hypothetical protein
MNNDATFQGYFGVIPENMALPKALFLSEAEAIKYAGGAKVRKYGEPSLFPECLGPDCSNP